MAKVQKNGLLEEKELFFYTKSGNYYTNHTLCQSLRALTKCMIVARAYYISKILFKAKVKVPLGDLCTVDNIFLANISVGIGR